MNDKLADKILDTIQKEHIEPKPRWQFLLKDWVVWALALLSVILGSHAFGILLFKLSRNGFEFIAPQHSKFSYYIETIPYIWIVLLIIFIAVVWYNVRHTKKGYKYQTVTILFGAILASMILGTLLYVNGTSKRFDDDLTKRFPKLQERIDGHAQFWNNPDEGRLMGRITEITPERTFMLDAFGQEWEVINTNPASSFLPQENLFVHVTGEKINETQFEAEQIAPVAPPRPPRPRDN